MSGQTYDRRAFMEYFAAAGLGSTLLPGVLWAQVAAGAEITAASVKCAEEIAGLAFDDDEREMMVAGLRTNEARIRALHAVELSNGESPVLTFNPLPPGKSIPAEPPRTAARRAPAPRAVPANLEELAFASVAELGALIRARRITSTQITDMYLARIKRLDSSLHSVITLTEERARAQPRTLSRAAARNSLGGEGPARGPRLQDHMGRRPVPRSGAR